MLIHYTTEQDAVKGTPPSMAPLVLGVNYSLLAIASLMVGCRILVKAKLGKLAIEDGLIVLTTVIVLVLVVSTHLNVQYGLGRHLGDIELEWWPEYGKYAYLHMTLGCVPYPLTKISMLCFYLRLAPQPTFRKICHATIVYIATTATVMALLNLFGCTPVRGGWDHSPELGAKCLDVSPYLYFHTGMSTVTDVLLMLLPVPILLRLQLRPKTKYGLVAMFALGILLTSVSAYSVYAIYTAYHTPDYTWYGAKSWMWSMAEFNVGIIVACMPSMLLFCKWLCGNMADGTKSTGSGSGRTPGMNATIGSGGRGRGRGVGRYSHHEMTSRTSVSLGSREYIMQDVDGIVKSTEVVVVEMARLPGE